MRFFKNIYRATYHPEGKNGCEEKGQAYEEQRRQMGMWKKCKISL